MPCEVNSTAGSELNLRAGGFYTRLGLTLTDKAASERADAALKYYVLFCTLCGVYTEFGIHLHDVKGQGNSAPSTLIIV